MGILKGATVIALIVLCDSFAFSFGKSIGWTSGQVDEEMRKQYVFSHFCPFFTEYFGMKTFFPSIFPLFSK
jgi:hypothetical protein